MKRFWLAGFALLLVLGACSSNEEKDAKKEMKDTIKEEAVDKPQHVAEKEEKEKEETAVALKGSLVEIDPLRFDYQVANGTDANVTLAFPSSQRYDYEVTNDKGETVFLFSSAASFAQGAGEETYKAGGAAYHSLDVSTLGLAPGAYKLSAWLTSKNGKEALVTTDFDVK